MKSGFATVIPRSEAKCRARDVLKELNENKGTRVSRVSRVSGLLGPPSTLIIGLTPP